MLVYGCYCTDTLPDMHLACAFSVLTSAVRILQIVRSVYVFMLVKVFYATAADDYQSLSIIIQQFMTYYSSIITFSISCVFLFHQWLRRIYRMLYLKR